MDDKILKFIKILNEEKKSNDIWGAYFAILKSHLEIEKRKSTLQISL